MRILLPPFHLTPIWKRSDNRVYGAVVGSIFETPAPSLDTLRSGKQMTHDINVVGNISNAKLASPGLSRPPPNPN